MAKKEKIELTPEELEAKETRSKEKRGIFGNTFVKSMAALLALLLVYSIAYIAFGKSPATVAAGPGKVETTKSDSDDSGSDDAEGPAETTAAAGDSAGTTAAAGDKTPAGTTAAAKDNAAAELVKVINDATAKVVNEKVGYTWSRDRVIKEAIDVGSMTSVVNTVIKMFDKSDKAGLDNTVGWFLETSQTVGNGKPVTGKAAKGAGKIEGRKDFETMKASKLTAADVTVISAKDGVYQFTLKPVTNPKRDNKTSLSRLTNDFVIEEDVSAALEKETKGAVKVAGSTVKYKNIKVTATIKDGKFQEYKISYYFNATPLKVALPKPFPVVDGFGGGQNDTVYSDFAY